MKKCSRNNLFKIVLALCLSLCWMQSAAAEPEGFESDMPGLFGAEEMPPVLHHRPRPGLVWRGPASYDSGEMTLTAGGITARIILEDDAAEIAPVTQVIGIGGEPVGIEELDLSDVAVHMWEKDGDYGVHWVLQHPLMGLRGRIQYLDPEAETLTVHGITVEATEFTRIRAFRRHHPHKPILFSELREGMPVRIAAHFVENVYLGVGIMAHTAAPSISRAAESKIPAGKITVENGWQ